MMMISKLFRPRGIRTSQPIASVPPGLRLYAIGDIHGRLDLLDQLLLLIDTDHAARGDAEIQLLFLGDLIDRGPQSAQVIELLENLKRRRPNTRFLLGNHEEVFLLALGGDMKALRFFVRIGGKETILSYGLSDPDYAAKHYDELFEWLEATVPERDIVFLEAFDDIIVIGDYAFVHAGIRPNVALDLQKTEDMRWIREAFLDHDRPHEKVIVHGHSISDDAVITPNRIGLDTGAYASGKLTAMGFESDDRWLIQTQPI